MLKSKNKKLIGVAILILLIFFGVFFFYRDTQVKNINLNKNTPQPSSLGPLTQTSPLIEVETKQGGSQTTLEINGVKYGDLIKKKTNVYDFMSKLRNEGKVNFVEKNYIGMGELITEINGIKNNNQKSWIYYVNGKEASVGVSNYKVNPGDIVSWKYEKSNY